MRFVRRLASCPGDWRILWPLPGMGSGWDWASRWWLGRSGRKCLLCGLLLRLRVGQRLLSGLRGLEEWKRWQCCFWHCPGSLRFVGWPIGRVGFRVADVQAFVGVVFRGLYQEEEGGDGSQANPVTIIQYGLLHVRAVDRECVLWGDFFDGPGAVLPDELCVVARDGLIGDNSNIVVRIAPDGDNWLVDWKYLRLEWAVHKANRTWYRLVILGFHVLAAFRSIFSCLIIL